MNAPPLPTATAWITVVETSQGPSSQVNWTKMRGVKHHPLFTADQLLAYAALLAQETAASRATECEQKQPNTDATQAHLAAPGRPSRQG